MDRIPETPTFPCALTIAGSDPTGGAGVQMDLKTFSACGVWGCSAITALTVQGIHGVESVHGTGPEIVASQVRILLKEMPVGAVKTGMLWDTSTIRAVCRTLPTQVPLIVDPVLAASSGGSLFEHGCEEAVDIYEKELIPRAHVFTPNLPEAEKILSCTIKNDQDIEDAARAFLDMGASSIVMKGGHLDEGTTVRDRFFTADTRLVLEGPRSPHRLHGTGCCFSAALAAWIARGSDPRTAFSRAKACVSHAVSHAVRSPAGWYLLMPEWRNDRSPAPPDTRS
jgi:hydroxymethylpyrimidine/phosphomethylpyrimidine kinase